MVTVSLFVAELAFGEQTVGNDARLGVLVASLVAALIGSAIMVPGRQVDDHSMDEHVSADDEVEALANRLDGADATAAAIPRAILMRVVQSPGCETAENRLEHTR